MLKFAAERFIEPDQAQYDGPVPSRETYSVYLTRGEILKRIWIAENERDRQLNERCRKQHPGWREHTPITFESWKELHKDTTAHPDKYKHHGAIPGTAKIVKEWPLRLDQEDRFRTVTVVWQTKPTSADVHKARAEWKASVPKPDHTVTLADAAHLRDQDTDGTETRKVLRKEGFTVGAAEGDVGAPCRGTGGVERLGQRHARPEGQARSGGSVGREA
jgi:hypothetical protein